MDWFKVDVLDILNSGLSDKEIGQLVNYMALISLKERLPNKNELKTIIRPSSFKKLEDLLNKNEKKLNFYEEKVMKNIENINKFREKDKEKKRKLRGSSYSNDEVVPQDKPGDVPPYVSPSVSPGSHRRISPDRTGTAFRRTANGRFIPIRDLEYRRQPS